MTDIPKINNWRNQPHIDNLNEAIEVIQGIVDQGIEGPAGEDGEDGTDGDNGWSPVLGIESDSGNRYLFVADWVGGEGTKPATGDYIGSTGLVASIDDAINIRGAAGEDGTDGTDGVGVPAGGADGNILVKVSATDYDTTWASNTFIANEDTPGGYGTSGQFISTDGTQLVWASVASDLIGLDDTPSSYGTEGQVLAVNATTDGVEWVDVSGGGASNLTDLNDTPASYGTEGQVLAVNASTDGVEWVDVSSGVTQFTGLSDTPSDYGTDGQVLTSTGSGMAWEDASGGGGLSISFGTFTPTIPAFNGSYNTQNGVYWDLGDVVFISVEFDCSSPGDNSLYVEGLPFTADTNQDVDPAMTLAAPLNLALPSGAEYAVFNAFNNRIYLNDSAGNGATTGSSRFGLLISGWYKKAP